MIKKIFFTLLGLFACIAVAAFLYLHLNKSPQIFEQSIAGIYHAEARLVDPASEVSTQSGKLVGFADNYATYAWIGVPYAQAPIDTLRWRAPQPFVGWEDTHEAIEYGSPCVQFWGSLAGVEGEDGDVVGSEDCLFLNVWAPRSAKTTSKPLPVMFWIHGGGNDSGTGNIFQGHHLSGTKDVVVVTINYRVGLLGWFSHDAVRETAANREDASGNFGTLDIIAALKWVNQNISGFGGDPNNVTIFGESAGGRNVYSMLASPLAKGLFDKAIVQSGTTDTTLLNLAEDYDDNKIKSEVSGLRNSSNGLISLVYGQNNQNLEKEAIRSLIRQSEPHDLMQIMRQTDAKQLMTMASNNSSTQSYIKVARVLRDGYVLPKASTMSLLSNPSKYNSVPLMLGTNRDEQKLFMARNPRYSENFLGVFPRPIDSAQYQRVSDYVSDNWKAGSVDEPAKRISQSDSPPVYAYRFDWDESPKNWFVDLAELIGAAHGLEISFVFGDFTGGTSMGPLLDKTNAEGRKALSLTMMDYWAEFAHSGSPGNGKSGRQNLWSPWRAKGNNLMLLDTPADGGARMAELRINVADIKQRISKDDIIVTQRERCEAYAALFLHGYQTSDFWDAGEYSALGCDEFPVGLFRDS